MKAHQLKAGRVRAGLTQVQAARRLGVSQPYLSQLERGDRAVTDDLARRAATAFGLPATAWPLPEETARRVTDPGRLARQLAGLGYPGFAHLRGEKANPAAVLLEALRQPDLEVRLAEALPWVALAYPELDWDWLVPQAKLHELQNRLGFVVALARAAAARLSDEPTRAALAAVEQRLEHARLAREDTLCRESMPPAERRWLMTARPELARHWNLLTSLTAEQLAHA
jgi:transcriptional regulator with XRE-family HTH domain